MKCILMDWLVMHSSIGLECRDMDSRFEMH